MVGWWAVLVSKVGGRGSLSKEMYSEMMKTERMGATSDYGRMNQKMLKVVSLPDTYCY